MPASNTKLSRDQKEILADMKQEFIGECGQVFSFPELGLTVAMLPAGKLTKVATYISSPDEKKFRRKVGEFLAIKRVLWYGEYMLIPVPTSYENWATGFSDLTWDCLP